MLARLLLLVDKERFSAGGGFNVEETLEMRWGATEEEETLGGRVERKEVWREDGRP